MAHIKKVTVAKASAEEKQVDTLGMVFVEIWLFAFTWILAGAFSKQSA